jgi:polysaccharide biosynthesis/export protein
MFIKFIRIISDRAIYYGAILCLLSMFSLTEMAYAQVAQNADSLEGLMTRIEELGGKAGRLGGQLGVGSAVDAARSDAVEGFARSPFSRPEGAERAELDTRFRVGELLLIEKYCRSIATPGEEQVLRVMTEFSLTERDYCRRIRDRILQVGYHVFDGVITPELLVNGSIDDSYILGIGDELVISFEGREANSITIWIDREGRITHKDIGRIRAAGKTFGAFREELKREIERTKIGTKVFVSMGSVRQISIRVTGEVRKPGLHLATGLSSVFDAISLAGGVKKTGSLRRIQVRRGNRIFWLDAYELMYSHFGGQNLDLRDGDHILVPAIGSTIAVSGDVKRPGIFELSEGQKSISVVEALMLAGGYIRSKGNLLQKLSFDQAGRENISEIGKSDLVIGDSDILVVNRRNNSRTGIVSIVGHVTSPGIKAISSHPTISSLLRNNNNFRDNPYLLFGVLETTDPSTLARRYFPISLKDVVGGKKDYALRPNDRLIVLSSDEIRYLSSDEVRKILADVQKSERNGEERDIAKESAEQDKANVKKLIDQLSIESNGSSVKDSDLTFEDGQKSKSAAQAIVKYPCLGLRSLATILKFTRSSRFAAVVQAVGGIETIEAINPRSCPEIYDQNPDLLSFVLEHSVAINGEVRTPGAYPVTNEEVMSSLLAVSGGLTLEADISQVEISRYTVGEVNRAVFDFSKTNLNSVKVGPGDVAKFNPIYKDRDNGPILLSGEFLRPGLYDIRRGERLSEVVARAGGLTEQAYPYGAVFTRERVKRAEKVAFRRAAKEMKLAAVYASGNSLSSPQSISALQSLTEGVENTEALGRVVIEADPTVILVRPELDTVMEPGDRIFMPKRPNSVLVMGDVLNPGALQFISGTKADVYVEQAGGMRQSADEDRMFLVYPNGVAQPISVSVWNYNPIQVPPGSTLVVPMDPAPLDIFTFAKDMTTLISQMAITAASLAVIGNN